MVSGRAPGPDPATGWMSYDSVADTYLEVAVPWFTPLAHDLVAAVSPREGDTVLDVGTGTGLVGSLAMPAVGTRGWVIGADPSARMLGHARRAGLRRAVAAKAPGLPFADGAFNVVLMNLVLSHLPDLGAGLADVARVMRPGGRLGATAWAESLPAGDGNERPAADEIVATVRRALDLDVPAPVEKPVPWEDDLRSRRRLAEVVAAAGLAELGIDLHRYERTFSVEEFLAGWGSSGRYLRHAVGEARWKEFVGTATMALRDRFGNSISCADEVWVVTARRP